MQELPIPAISQANLSLVLRPLLQSIALTYIFSNSAFTVNVPSGNFSNV